MKRFVQADRNKSAKKVCFEIISKEHKKIMIKMDQKTLQSSFGIGTKESASQIYFLFFLLFFILGFGVNSVPMSYRDALALPVSTTKISLCVFHHVVYRAWATGSGLFCRFMILFLLVCFSDSNTHGFVNAVPKYKSFRFCDSHVQKWKNNSSKGNTRFVSFFTVFN